MTNDCQQHCGSSSPDEYAALTFADLARENANRCNESYHPIAEWTLMDWAASMAGECGEACNVAKKIRRLQENPSDLPHDCVDYAALRMELADEIADAVIYADLLCSRVGINMAHAICRKFNRTSLQINSNRRLPNPTEKDMNPKDHSHSPDPNLPPIGDGPRRKMLLEIEVTADFEKRLDNHWMILCEVHADRYRWRWADAPNSSNSTK